MTRERSWIPFMLACGIMMASVAPTTWIIIGWCVAGLLIAALLYVGLFQDRSRGRKRCPKCWYNMTGAPSLVCPECGHDAREERRFYRTRRRRWAVISAAALALTCGYLWLVYLRVADLNEPIKSAFHPTCYMLAALPGAPQAYQGMACARIRRFGLWSWEEQLLLWSCDTILKSSSVRGNGLGAVLLLRATGSRRALERLWALRNHADPQTRQNAIFGCIKRASELSDSQLSTLLDELADCRLNTTYRSLRCDDLLSEMLRRKRPEFRAQIERCAASLLAQAEILRSQRIYGAYGRFMDLEFVTALRRFDGKADPLWIQVKGAPKIECTDNDLPTLEVAITNMDVEGTSVGFTFGGDYRSGREARWRIEVRDQDAREMPRRPPFSGWAGGLVNWGPLSYGKSYESKLDMDLYVLPLPPGRYCATVLYHNSATIADCKSLPDLIVFRSDPFELVVHPAPPGAPIARRPTATMRWYGDSDEW